MVPSGACFARSAHRATIRQTRNVSSGVVSVAGSLKFCRQHQIGLFICDFASLDGRLIIELDRSQHVDRAAYDERRDSFLRSAGFRVLRFWNADVQRELDAVVGAIFEALRRTDIDGRL
jgi:very-short-patch-repair endonuclease